MNDKVTPGKALLSSKLAPLNANLIVESDSIPRQMKKQPIRSAINAIINFITKILNSLSMRLLTISESDPPGMSILRKSGPRENIVYLLKEANSTCAT